MKLYSWNVNGIRSVFNKGFLEWMQTEQPDIVCLQEIKADVEDLNTTFTQVDGYYAYFNSAQKKGYAGTAVYTKLKPNHIETSIGHDRFDSQGRMLRLDFDDFTLFNFYIPNGARDKRDIPYKLEVYEQLLEMFDEIKEKKVILTGDFNIAHQEIDVFHAKQNKNNTMFTPEERKQIDAIVDLGYGDTLRMVRPEEQLFSWWPYMGDLRDRNIGWRIDYFFVSSPLKDLVIDANTHREVEGSDHGPISLEVNLDVEMGEGPVYPKDTLF